MTIFRAIKFSRFFITQLIFALFIVFSFDVSAQNKENESLKQIISKSEQNPKLRSLIIEQDGEILMSRMFGGRSASTPYNIKSASKSLISLLVGIAIQEGFISSIDEPISTYFSDYFERKPDSKKEVLTIRQLLSMQSGLESTSFGNYGRWVISKNWVEFALDQPFIEEAGGKMVYSTATSHLLSVIITKASGMSTMAFANKYLFNPLNIRIGGWDKDPQGYYMGGNNVALTPRDMLKIGRLMLNGGEYEGKRIVNKEWVDLSFQTYTQSNFNPYDYGFMWWNKMVGDYKVYFAWGFGGQYIFMIPELNSTIVMTSAILSTSQNRNYKEPIFELLEEEVIPFLSNKANK